MQCLLKSLVRYILTLTQLDYQMKVPTETVGSMIWSLKIVYLFVVFLSVGHIWVTCLMMVRRQPACVTVSTLHLSNSNPVVRFDSLDGDRSCFQGVDLICCQNRINLTLSLLGMIGHTFLLQSLTRDILYSMENMAFGSLLRWKLIELSILSASLIPLFLNG